jgi:ABC-type Fe3+ transport system substrate-binding protein
MQDAHRCVSSQVSSDSRRDDPSGQREALAGSHLFDAVTNSGMEIYLLAKMGLLARYTTPEFSSFMADSKDPAGRWVDMYSNLRMIGYNTKLVPKE